MSKRQRDAARASSSGGGAAAAEGKRRGGKGKDAKRSRPSSSSSSSSSSSGKAPAGAAASRFKSLVHDLPTDLLASCLAFLSVRDHGRALLVSRHLLKVLRLPQAWPRVVPVASLLPVSNTRLEAHEYTKALTLVQFIRRGVGGVDLSSRHASDTLVLAVQACWGARFERLYMEDCAQLGEDAVVAAAGRCGEALGELRVSGTTSCTDRLLEALAASSTRLRSLAVARCPVTDRGVVALAGARGGLLLSLDLGYAAGVTDASAASLAAHCPSLERLRVCGTALTDEGLGAIVRGCPRLKLLSVRQCAGVAGGPAIGRLPAVPLPYLQVLDARECPRAGDALAEGLVARLASLRVLAMSSCAALTDAGVEAVVTGVPGLAELYLSGCRRLTARSVDAVEAGLPELAVLRMDRCSEELAGRLAGLSCAGGGGEGEGGGGATIRREVSAISLGDFGF